jgi:hypothetical protein
MGWLTILILAAIVIFLFKGTHSKVVKVVVVVILITFLVTLIFTYKPLKDAGVNLKSPSGVITAAKVYFSWIGKALDNARSLTGSVTRMNWIPKVNNATIN